MSMGWKNINFWSRVEMEEFCLSSKKKNSVGFKMKWHWVKDGMAQDFEPKRKWHSVGMDKSC